MTIRWNSGWPTDDEGCTLINNDVVPPAEAYFNSGSMMDSTGMYTSGGVPPVCDPAANATAPVISGDAVVGSVLTTTNGTWTGTSPFTYTYQWMRGGTALAAYDSTYTTVSADIGESMTCVVSADNACSSDAATSNAISVTSAFTPAELFASSEVGVWYDPSDLSTMFQDSAGTTPVTATGQSVGLILDKSGNNKHASQATAASRPIYRDVGGYQYLEFDGVDDSLATAAIDFTSSAQVSVFLGAMRESVATRGMVYELTANATNTVAGSFGLRYPENATTLIRWDRATVNGVAHYKYTTDADTTPVLQVLSCIYDQTQTTAALSILPRLNGATATTTATGASGTAGTGFANDVFYIGRRGSVSMPYDGRIYSLIVRGTMSDAGEIDDAETWVNGKTGAY